MEVALDALGAAVLGAAVLDVTVLDAAVLGDAVLDAAVLGDAVFLLFAAILFYIENGDNEKETNRETGETTLLKKIF
jgi:hypothetical protein